MHIFDEEIARIGYFGRQNKYEVYVKTDDWGYLPHVHIRSVETKGHKFESCVQLKDNSYFLHGQYGDVMTPAMQRSFEEFMHQEIHHGRFKGTMYEFAVMMWNFNNASETFEAQYDDENNVVIPNYSNMKK